MKTLTQREVLLFWLPLAATWWLMALEQPLCSGLAARLPDPEQNLAAFGVAMSFFFVIESPVWLLLSAATALVADLNSYRRMRDFACVLSAMTSLLLFLIFLPAPFTSIARDLFGVPEELIALAQSAGLILVPAPFFVGYRRFYQGILIGDLNTKAVGFCTVLRLLSMVLVGLGLFLYGELSGAAVGAWVLTAGVAVEALLVRAFAESAVRKYLQGHQRAGSVAGSMLSTAYLIRFYFPLMLNGLVFSITGPMFTFFMSRLGSPFESLAVYPVVNALIFMFVSVTIGLQDVVIARLGPNRENFGVLHSFAVRLGGVLTVLFALIVFSPLLRLGLTGIIGLRPPLADFAIFPSRIGVLLPLLSVVNLWQRGVLMHARHTVSVSWASAVEVGMAGAALFAALLFARVAVGGYHLGLPGVAAVFAALSLGRLCAGLYLRSDYRRVIV